MKAILILIISLCFTQFIIAQPAVPSVYEVYPATAKRGSTVILLGSGFINVTSLSFGGVQINSFTIKDQYTMTAELDTAASGEIAITTPGGTATLDGFIFIDSACTIYNSASIVQVSVCNKAFPYTWRGNVYPAAGTYPVHSSDVYGCDSIFTLQLTASGPCTWSELAGTDSLQANNMIFSIINDSLNNIYTAGTFTNSNGKYYVAKWDGTKWSELGGANSLAANSTIKSLCMDQNGNIYAAGSFKNINGHCYIAKWNGSNWSELGGLDALPPYGSIRSICSDKMGNIYAAGWSTNASGKHYVVKWDGNSWSELGGANSLAANDLPWAICSDKSGNIYTGGLFTNASGSIYVAKWDGTKWSELGGNNSFAANIIPRTGDQVGYLCTDPAGNVYVAGDYVNSSGYDFIAKWDGTKWSEVGGVNSLKANSLQQVVKVDSAGNVYAAGYFSNINGDQYVARWDGKQWSEVGGLSGLSANDDIIDLCPDKWGNVYAGGVFVNNNGHEYIAKYIQFISVKDGNWNDPATWLEGSVPPGNANVIIKNTVTVTANASCVSLDEESSGHVIVNPNVKLFVGN